MDINQLIHRQQVSAVRADSAASLEARLAHRGLAAAYAERIAALRRELAIMETTG